jgi:hypothetical protein
VLTNFSRDLLPNLIVIGAMKAGTTSLHAYLSLHPEIFMSANKEPRFFTEEWNWHKGLEWYEAQFPERVTIRGESTPDYTKLPEIRNVPERIHSLIPDVRLIYLVRDPIDRSSPTTSTRIPSVACTAHWRTSWRTSRTATS